MCLSKPNLSLMLKYPHLSSIQQKYISLTTHQNKTDVLTAESLQCRTITNGYSGLRQIFATWGVSCTEWLQKHCTSALPVQLHSAVFKNSSKSFRQWNLFTYHRIFHWWPESLHNIGRYIYIYIYTHAHAHTPLYYML